MSAECGGLSSHPDESQTSSFRGADALSQGLVDAATDVRRSCVCSGLCERRRSAAVAAGKGVLRSSAELLFHAAGAKGWGCGNRKRYLVSYLPRRYSPKQEGVVVAKFGMTGKLVILSVYAK